MKKFLRAFKTQAEYLAFTASTEFILDNVSSCREGDLVYFNSEQCGGQGMHRTISGETYCDGYDKRVYLYKQVSYDGGVTWETTATTSSLVEKNSEDCGYVPPTSYDLLTKLNVNSTSSPTKIVNRTTGFNKVEIDGVEQPSVETGYTFNTTGEHTVKFALTDPTTIDYAAFSGDTSLTSVKIKNGVTTIGVLAFDGCTNLTSVEIPDSVRTIYRYAFAYCGSLTSIDIPSGVTELNEGVFQYCTGLTSVEIPNRVTRISTWAFRYCSNLTGITVNSVTPPTVSNDSFVGTNNCPIFVPCESVDAYKSATNWSTYASRIQAIPGSCPIVLTAKFNITDTNNPTRIASGTSSFNKIEIDGVVQPNVTTGYTFSTTGEHTVKYYLKYTSIGQSAFQGCKSLTSIDIPDSVTSIGEQVFYECTGLTNIDIPDSVTKIPRYSFVGCGSITSITIPNSVTTIEYGAFMNCSGITSIVVPDSVTSIGNAVFSSCKSLTSAIIPNTMTYIGESFFGGCINLTKLNSNVDGVFNIPSSVTSIGNYAFGWCHGLTSINIPSGVTSIGSSAFRDCSSLTSITSNAATAPTIDFDTFNNVGSNGTLYVPQGSSGYNVWMVTYDYYLGEYNWTKVEQ